MQTSVEEIENLLRRSELEKVIELLLENTKNQFRDLYNEVLLHSSRFHDAKNIYELGRLNFSEYRQEMASVSVALQNVIDKYRTHWETFEKDFRRRAELEKTDLQAQISTLTAKLTKIQADSSKNQEIQTLQAKIGKLKSQINALNAEKEGFVKKIGELNRNLETERLEKRNLLEKIKILEGQKNIIAPPKNIFTDQTFDIKGIKFKMIFVESGTFMMGDNEFENAKPIHEVSLDSFWIAQTQCTQELWQAVMGNNPSHFKGAKLPVECVSWNDCQEFIKKLNVLTKKTFSLPTEAQWEYAARGGKKSKGYKYAGSDNIEEVAWYNKNSEKKTHEVATKKPNELGIYDMSGNVFEWCLDAYDKKFYESAEAKMRNPINNRAEETFVLRGGNYSNYCSDKYYGLAHRFYYGEDVYYCDGFRLVLGL